MLKSCHKRANDRLTFGNGRVLLAFIAATLVASLAYGQKKDDKELLQNASFEEPAIQPGYSLHKPMQWQIFSSQAGKNGFGMSTELVQDGKQALHVAAQDVRGAFQGIVQTLAVQEGRTYEFSVYVHNDPEKPLTGSVRAQMSIEWKNERDEEVRRTWGPEWNRRLPRHRWEHFSVQARAPRDAVTAIFAVTQFDEQRSEEGGAFYMDGASVQIKR